MMTAWLLQLVTAGLMAFAVAPPAVAADTPSTRPSVESSRDGRPERPFRADRGPRGDRGERGDRAGRGERPGDGPPRRFERQRVPTDEAWAASVEFLREHSPLRLAVYEQTAQNRPKMQERLRARMHGRVESLRRLERDDPPAFRFALQQFQAEDRILRQIMTARDVMGPDRGRLEEGLHDELVAYVERSLAERQARINRLQAELDAERDNLRRDRERIEELAARFRDRFERLLPRSRINPTTRPVEP
jgi:hypothetical protein